MTFEEFCQLGEEADGLNLQDDLESAQEIYFSLLDRIQEDKVIDNFVLSKVTLGLLLSLIKQNEFEKAFEIWTADMKKSLFGIGVYGLENGQVSVQDTVLYDFICAFFHSLSAGDPKKAARQVSFYMRRICGYALDKKPELLDMAINNWKKHLQEIFGNETPAKFSAEISEMMKKAGKINPLQDIAFPDPAPWVVDWPGRAERLN